MTGSIFASKKCWNQAYSMKFGRFFPPASPPTATAMQAIGYKEFVDALTNGGDVAAAAALVQQRSRNYAKRQLTWLRRNEQIHWILQPHEPDFSAVFQQACANIPFFA